MNEEQIKLEMQKPIGGALTAVEWYLVFTFVDHAMKQDNMFATVEDSEALAKTVKRLHDQIFPPVKDNMEEFENLIIPKKKLILPQGPDIIV